MTKIGITIASALLAMSVMAETPFSGDNVNDGNIYDTSVNTGVGSFNGDLSNSFNNVTGDSDIKVTTTHIGGFDNTQTNNSHTTQDVTQTVKTTQAIHLSNLTTSGLDTCLGSSTGGISAPGFSISGGSTVVDDNCVRMKNAKLLIKLGLVDAAVALIALDPSVAKALRIAYPELHSRLVEVKVEEKEVLENRHNWN